MPDYDPKSIPILDDVIEADIIEETDAEDKHRAPIIDISDMEDELSVDDGAINLFSTPPVELSPEDVITDDDTADDSHIDDLDTDESAPSIGAIVSLDDSPADALDVTAPVNTEDEDSSSYLAAADIEDADLPDNETAHGEEAPYESALIDYHDDADAVEESGDHMVPEAAQAEDEQQAETEELENSVSEQSVTRIENQATQSTIALDDVVDDVVNDIVSQLLPDLQQQLRHLVKQALEDRLPAEIICQHKADTDQGSS